MVGLGIIVEIIKVRKSQEFPRSFLKNVGLVGVDSAHLRVVGDLQMKKVFWYLFCRSESHGLVTLNAAAGE
jgi:hypothetical protein